ncbi:DUF6708 domain-containing protein [Achromobacter arsenitoxydans]|uniref:DUF6708 domain-containing protein n=1 Tax=Achromobacter arsenitoxydans TaxID=1147684 RepID=UPI001EE65AEA|nr:DUF6708 domain-containing protein [Achromobacter arsenitoxydans]
MTEKKRKQLLDAPTKGWKADLPLPQIPPSEPLLAIGLPPNFADDTCLELHTSRILNRTGAACCAFGVILCALMWIFLAFFEIRFKTMAGDPLLAVMVIGGVIGLPIAGIGMLRTVIAPPRDEPIRFNRKRGKVYLYRFHSGGPLSRKGWGVVPVVFNWADLRAEAWSRMAATTSAPIFAWGVDIAVVEPGTNHVIDRFQLAGSNANGEHMWAMARAFMNQGPEALPKYPRPPRDWNNDVPPYHLVLRLAPKVQWPADMDRESRTAP